MSPLQRKINDHFSEKFPHFICFDQNKEEVDMVPISPDVLKKDEKIKT